VNKPLSGETYAAVTVPANIKSEGIVADALIYIPCKVTDNKVSFILPMSDNKEITKNNSLLDGLFNVSYADSKQSELRACVLTNVKSNITANGKFKVIGSSTVKNIDIETVEAYLEFLYNFYKDELGFDKIEKYSGWPMTVTIRGLYPLLEGDYAGKGAAGFFYNFGVSRWIVINEDQLGNFEDIQKTLIHEMFHFVQSQYTSNTWFDEATAVWVEEYYKPNSGYVGDLYKKYGGDAVESQIMDGPTNTRNRSEGQHGYGSASFVKYLTNRYGRDKLVAVYSAMPSGDSVDILSGIAPIKEWINDFYVQLLSRNIYDTVPNLITYKKTAKIVDVEVKTTVDPNAVPVKEVIEIPPYGARVIYVNLQFEDPTKVSPSIILEGSTAAPDLTMNWMYYGNKEAKTSATGSDELGLTGLDQISKTKHVLGLLITNQTKDYIETDVTFEVKNIPPLEVLVGTWTDLNAFVKSVDLHPELEQLIANPPEQGAPVEGGEMFTELSEGCEFMTAEAIYELFKSIKEMEGKTFPAEFVITQTSETEGTLLSSMDSGDGMSSMGDALPFKYEDGIMKIYLAQSEDGNDTKMEYTLNFAYDQENIVCNGSSNITWASEGQQIINLNFIYDGKIPAPKTTP